MKLSTRCLLRAELFKNPITNKILIVGDRPSKEPALGINIPFCSDDNCSGWLNKQLSIDEDHLQWINSADLNGHSTSFLELSQRLPAKIVIALGNNASKWLTTLGVDHVKTYHPQFWKRFHSKERYPLLDLLENKDLHLIKNKIQ